MHTEQFFEKIRDDEVSAAIAAAEKQTSGEIRVFVTRHFVEQPIEKAREQFVKLGMQKTAQRNGVLLYFAPLSQSFAILGDEGIHQKCGQNFWDTVTVEMIPLLKENKFTEAIVLAVTKIGVLLSQHFPYEKGDRNELPDDIARD